ncbi:hypothetical protein TL16_g02839 [Triparma laevis f. inornata]|uniref:Uncharacterized protein n=1 Tax=Triparma laevis f. inornata TaxID=1714386 RepID=A0A9W6ZW47_9STRA|nr:hypothetical protein TL16_g02839 [Triparma laevis f. inornata]
MFGQWIHPGECTLTLGRRAWGEIWVDLYGVVVEFLSIVDLRLCLCPIGAAAWVNTGSGCLSTPKISTGF